MKPLVLTLIRFKSTKNDTLGKLSLDGQFECYTLEDEYRAIKVPRETRIPAGNYEIVQRKAGRIYANYCQRFNENHPIMWLKNVPGFSYIYIHILNTEDETEGCIGVGQGYHLQTDGRYFLERSTKAYLALYKQVRVAWMNRRRVCIVVMDKDLI